MVLLSFITPIQESKKEIYFYNFILFTLIAWVHGFLLLSNLIHILIRNVWFSAMRPIHLHLIFELSSLKNLVRRNIFFV